MDQNTCSPFIIYITLFFSSSCLLSDVSFFLYSLFVITQKHLDEIKDRITKAMQDSVAESRESCADPSKSTEPTIETKEVQFVDGQQLENNDPSNLPLKAPLVLTEWTQIDGKKSWDTSRDLCTTQGQELCTYNQLCPNGKGNVPTGLSILTHLLSGDQWVPILPQKNGNKWIQAGTRAGGKCNPLSTYHGSKGSWMESTAYKPYKKWNVCCNIPIKTAPVVKTTIVGCDEKSSCATQTKDKEAIFDTKMNCISTKQSSIKSEKSIVVEQEECITKAKSKLKCISSSNNSLLQPDFFSSKLFFLFLCFFLQMVNLNYRQTIKPLLHVMKSKKRLTPNY